MKNSASEYLSLPPDARAASSASVSSEELPTIVAGAFDRLNPRLRARMLGRLLASVGPLALAVVGGGAFAKYAAQARWSKIPVSVKDAAHTTSCQVYELVRYVQQSDPRLADQILNVLARDNATITAFGASVAALLITHQRMRG